MAMWRSSSLPILARNASRFARLPRLWSGFLTVSNHVNDALRWSVYKSKISSISSIGALLHPQTLLLTYQATIETPSNRFIAAHVPLAVAARPNILGYRPVPSTGGVVFPALWVVQAGWVGGWFGRVGG